MEEEYNIKFLVEDDPLQEYAESVFKEVFKPRAEVLKDYHTNKGVVEISDTNQALAAVMQCLVECNSVVEQLFDGKDKGTVS